MSLGNVMIASGSERPFVPAQLHGMVSFGWRSGANIRDLTASDIKNYVGHLLKPDTEPNRLLIVTAQHQRGALSLSMKRGSKMDDPSKTEGAPPRSVHIEKKKVNWLARIALLAGILALLFALGRCGRDDTAAVTPAPTPTATDVVATTPNAGSATALAGTSGLGSYLAGSEAAPRTFQFETLTFDTAKSTLRPDDAKEVATIAGVLKQYGDTHVRIAGYADARGPATANIALGKARADAVKAGLVAQGIDAGRIETVSGGESDPVDTNATALGQAENRRTELVVTSR